MPIARPMRIARAAALLRGGLVLLPLLLAGCIEFNLDPIEKDPIVKRATVTESFTQDAQAGVDLLLVLDRTGSMESELDALVGSADLLGQELDAAGLSWQLGVVGAEMSTAEAGWLLGTPWIVTSAIDVGAHLDGIVAQPPEQAGEAGIAAAIEALDLAGPLGVNAGFRRRDASLHVVFVSDGDDESDPWLPGDPVQELLGRLAIEADNDLPARASAVVGDGTCNDTRRGDRYIDVAQATGGVVVSICSNTFAPIVQQLSSASVVLPRVFELREQPASEAITVTVDGAALSDGWVYAPGLNAIVFEQAPRARARISVSYIVVVEDL